MLPWQAFLASVYILEYAERVLRSITFKSLVNLVGIILVIWPSLEKSHIFRQPTKYSTPIVLWGGVDGEEGGGGWRKEYFSLEMKSDVLN